MKCQKCNKLGATERWQGVEGFVNLCVDCRDAWLIQQMRHKLDLSPTVYEVARQKQKKARR